MIQITCKMFVLMMKGKARTRRCEVSVGRERRQRCDVSPWMRKRKHEVSVQWGWRTRWCKRRLQVCARRWGGEFNGGVAGGVSVSGMSYRDRFGICAIA